jgi:CRP-like cAMP-binding protein
MRMRMARSLAAADHEYFDARGYVGESVDEALTSPHTITGMRLRPWIESRFADRSRALGEASHHQGTYITKLITAAHAAGLVGLAAVVLFGLAVGGDGLASVAASLLYVEGVVKGLEALPPWVRQVHFGMASSLRIDAVLVHDAADDSQSAVMSTAITRGVTNLPDNCLIGIVTPPGIDADAALAQISDGSHGECIHVPQEPLAFDASILDHFRATVPDLDEVAVRRLLDRVSLGYLISHSDDLTRPLGPAGNHLTINERQRLAIAMALALEPRLLSIGPVLAFADTDTALPLIEALSTPRLPVTIVTVRTAEVASAMDLIIFANDTNVQTDTHENLLMGNADYSQLWSSRLTSIDVDLSVLGIDGEATGALLTRLVTERYPAGNILYREGAPADRIIFTISGKIEIIASDSVGRARRVALIGPGNHCGDLRLTTGEVRAETAVAVEDTVVRSLSREAISAGMAGLLDRSPIERRVVSAILRAGPSTIDELRTILVDLDDASIQSALALLTRDGALVEESGRFRTVHKRAVKTGASDILDRLADL